MSRQKYEKTFNTFVKGLMTEASELNFPENFSLYDKNFDLRRDGGRDRRKGMELLYPLGVTLTSTLYPVEFDDSFGVVPLAPDANWWTPPLDAYEVVPLAPTVKIISSVRYLEYDNGEPEAYSVTPLAPSVVVTTQVRYLTYDNGDPDSYVIVPSPPVVSVITLAAYLTYEIDPEACSIAPLAPIVKVTTQEVGDPHWDKVSHLLHFNFDNGEPSFLDETGGVWNSIGAVLSSEHSVFGSSSGYFNGSADITSNSSTEFGVEDYTIECFVRRAPGSSYQCLFDSRVPGTPGIGIYVAGASPGGQYPAVAHNTDVFLYGNILVPADTWTHLALVRRSGIVSLYVGGAHAGSAADNRNLPPTLFRIGRSMISGQPFSGYVDEFRSTEREARYTEDFDPPTKPFPNFGE